jgi:transcriptional regulator with XRE-family HTH domain
MITPVQCLEARKLLNWTRDRLGSRCSVSHSSVRFFEIGAKPLRPEDRGAIRSALEAAGIEFTNGSEPGVKLGKQG